MSMVLRPIRQHYRLGVYPDPGKLYTSSRQEKRNG